jgi:hypothetical protein
MRKTAIVLLAITLSVAACQPSSRTVVTQVDEPVAQTSPTPTVPATAAAPGEFAFPGDRGGRLLTELLTPSEKSRPYPIALASERRATSGAATTQAPTLPLPAIQAEPARLPAKPAPRVLRPTPPPEEMPLAGEHTALSLPQIIVLPAGERVRLPSTAVNEPPALPILAQPVIDRASLDDPTVDASQATALSAPPPDRNTPAPATRQAVADPFENRKSPRLPPDDPMPVTATPKPPR